MLKNYYSFFFFGGCIYFLCFNLGVVNIFCEELDGKYYRFGICMVCCNYLVLFFGVRVVIDDI